jgi:hypothetical protein
VGNEDCAQGIGALTTLLRRTAGERTRTDLVVLCVLSGLLIVLAFTRRDFLGDGVRHLPAVLSSQPRLGEPRWLLFPSVAWVWVRLLSGLGLVSAAESALQSLLWASVASGIAFLYGIRAWLLAECPSDEGRASALLLAGSCAPVLILFSDIAEPQTAAAIVVCGLAYARTRRDDPGHAERAAFVATGAIALAALIYQGAILALGMLPLVVSSKVAVQRRVMVAAGVSVLTVFCTMIGVQIAAGTAPRMAAAAAFGGERNPLTRSFMARPSAAKYLAAILAGPPQGIVALENFSGLPALASSLRHEDGTTARLAALNASRLLLGCLVVGILLVSGVRAASWPVLVALAVLLALPVLRNQQYAYPKFFILWPVPVSLLAIRCRPRTIALAAVAVLTSNTWLVVQDIRRGRELYTTVRHEYNRATSSTCWLTSGWSPPVSYLWPGTTVPLLGMLATGDDPSAQASVLTMGLRRCFCESDGVWTDTSSKDAQIVASIARHFDYTSIDLTSILVDPPGRADRMRLPGVQVYSEQDIQRICRLTGGSLRR